MQGPDPSSLFSSMIFISDRALPLWQQVSFIFFIHLCVCSPLSADPLKGHPTKDQRSLWVSVWTDKNVNNRMRFTWKVGNIWMRIVVLQVSSWLRRWAVPYAGSLLWAEWIMCSAADGGLLCLILFVRLMSESHDYRRQPSVWVSSRLRVCVDKSLKTIQNKGLQWKTKLLKKLCWSQKPGPKWRAKHSDPSLDNLYSMPPPLLLTLQEKSNEKMGKSFMICSWKKSIRSNLLVTNTGLGNCPPWISQWWSPWRRSLQAVGNSTNTSHTTQMEMFHKTLKAARICSSLQAARLWRSLQHMAAKQQSPWVELTFMVDLYHNLLT